MTPLENLREYGAAKVALIPRHAVNEIVDFLKKQPVYPGCHVRYAARGESTWDECVNEHVLCWHHRDVLRAPYLLDLALEISYYAKNWLGRFPPLMYSINAFCTRAGGPVRPDIQAWHRDTDDVRFLPLFVYLSDGCVQYVRNDDGRVTPIVGEAGTAFLSNTMLEHYGEPAQPGQDRIIFWARWGVSDRPASYVWDQMEPVEIPDRAIPEHAREQLKLLVK